MNADVSVKVIVSINHSWLRVFFLIVEVICEVHVFSILTEIPSRSMDTS